MLLPSVIFAKTTLYKYAINLESSKKKNSLSLNLKLPNKYKLYQVKVSLGKNKSFYRLRIGFFKSKKAAEKVARKFKSKYPKLWVDRLHKEDRKTLVAWLATKKVSGKRKEKLKGSSNKEKQAKKLMARAKVAMQERKYRLAVGLYS